MDVQWLVSVEDITWPRQKFGLNLIVKKTSIFFSEWTPEAFATLKN